MSKCENCIHDKVCLHQANIQTDTYAYMGVNYDTENCTHYKDKSLFVELPCKVGEWIKVSERLPDIDELCLLSMENRITKYRWVVIGYYHTNYDEYVTHWQPLPPPPEAE